MIRQILFLSLILFSGFAKGAESEQDIFSRARKLFAGNKFNEAITEYNKIPTSSDRWLLAVEEKAWSHLRLDQFDKALAEVRTLTSPALTGLTGTEPFLLQALAQLKICDYVSVFKTLKDFKTLKRQQVEAIQDLAKKGHNGISRQAMDKWLEKPEDWKRLGPMITQLPQLFYRDEVMLRSAAVKNKMALEKRLKELAIAENNENYRILQKLNLIEVESVQRVHIASQFDRKQGETVERDKYDLVFEDTEEVWLDELDSYQATVNRCQKKSGRSM